MTRPLGAALGDLLSSPMTGYSRSIHIHSEPGGSSGGSPTSRPTSMPTMLSGGAGLGYGYTSVLFIGLILILVVWATIARYDVKDDGRLPSEVQPEEQQQQDYDSAQGREIELNERPAGDEFDGAGSSGKALLSGVETV